MQKPWVPQFEITEQLIRSLITEQFPELSINSLKFFGSGWDNTLYLLNYEYVFRLPHRFEALKWLAIEMHALPELATYCSMPIPIPLFRGKATEEYPYIFYGYKLLPGKSIGNFELNAQAYKKLATNLGLFLKELHGVSLDFAQKKELMSEPAKVDFEFCVVRGLEAFESSIAHDLIPVHFDKNRIKMFIESWVELEVPKKQVILHGDLYARHVLINKMGDIVGIIDWGDLHIGCIGVDLGVVYWMLPLEFHDSFFEVYGAVPNDTLKIAQFRAFYVAIRLLIYGYEMRDDLIMCESLFSIENILKVLS